MLVMGSYHEGPFTRTQMCSSSGAGIHEQPLLNIIVLGHLVDVMLPELSQTFAVPRILVFTIRVSVVYFIICSHCSKIVISFLAIE